MQNGAKARLREARTAAGHQTPTAAAKAMGVNPVTYRAHENDDHPNSFRAEAPRYANFFGVSLQWLLTGEGTRRQRTRNIDVLGHVGAGATIHGIDEDRSTVRIGSVPGLDPDSVYALEVRGTSQWPRYVEGEIVLVEREPCLLEQARGRDVVVICKDGRHLLKRIIVEDGNLVTLESHNAPPERHVAIEAVYRVRGTIIR